MIGYNNSAPKAVNNVGQFGATEGSIGAYKSAAEYAADAKYWALLSQTKYSSVEEILAEVERLYAQGRLLEEDIKQLKNDFEAQEQILLGLIQSTGTAIDNTNAATELSKEATQEVLAQLDIISNMTVQTTLLPPGSLATGSYDNTSGVFSFGIPEGKPGRDGTDGTISDIGEVPVGVPVSDDYGFYVDKDDGGLYRANMADIASLVPSIRSISINGDIPQTGEVSFDSVTTFNGRKGLVIPVSGDYTVDQITGAAKSGANSDITSLSGLTSALSVSQGGTGAKNATDARTSLGLGSVATYSVVPVDKGGTGATIASSARTNLGLGSVSTESIVPIVKGGTGATSAENARLALVAAKSGDNFDITSLNNLTAALSVDQGGTGATSAASARSNLDVYSKGDVGGIFGLSPTVESLTNNLLTGLAVATESLVSSDSYVLPSFAELKGDKDFRAGFIGVDYRKNKTIRKSSNSTVTLSNQDSNAGSQVVDAVVYQDPSWPFSSVFPQKSKINNITIEGNSTSSPNQAAIYVLQGGVIDIDNVDTINCTYSIWSKDIFQSRINRVFSNNGKIRLDNGTSVILSGCGLASGDTNRTGAFDLTGMKYSTLISCTSDHTTNSAYALDACEGVTLVSCGCEAADTVTANSGTALAIKSNNRNISIDGFSCFPVPGQGTPLISIGEGNSVTINNFEVIPGVSYSGSDIYIYGPNSKIIINGGLWGTSGNLLPVITASSSAVGSTVTCTTAGGITYDYHVTGAGVVTPVARVNAIASILVNAEGSVIRGSGATCVRSSDGVYTVTVTGATSLSCVSVSLYGNHGFANTTISGNSVSVNIANTSLDALNAAFSFIAMA